MKTFGIFAIITILFNLAAHSVQAKNARPRSDESPATAGRRQKQAFKVLAEGSQSRVDAPFIFVARDAVTYGLLQKLVDGLPGAAAIDFSKHAVVAGFAGTRPTGGWSVDIRRAGRGTSVDVRGPRKDMMVTQVITTPFRVVQVPVEEFQNVRLDFSATFAKSSKTFRVDRGDFEYSGGIAGRRTEFKAAGTVRLMTFDDLATLVFDLKENGREGKRQLADVASGTLKNGALALSRVDAGSFVQLPRPHFTVRGQLRDKLLTLDFESGQTPFADGFVGRGIITATPIR